METAPRPERRVQGKFPDGVERGCVAQVAFHVDVAWCARRCFFHHRRDDGDARDAEED